MDDARDITGLLSLARSGDRIAENRLFEVVYAQLRRRAHTMLRGETHASSVSSGTLVHEAFLKLFRGGSSVNVQERAHFYLLAARSMRQVIIEHARKRTAAKRRGESVGVSLTDLNDPRDDSASSIDDIIAVSEICERLSVSKPACGQVVDLHFFAGLRIVEMADILGVSEVTISNRLTLAKALLHRELTGGGAASANAAGQ
jgi:RNA polymerase sigma factor (TIGR02999 family)